MVWIYNKGDLADLNFFYFDKQFRDRWSASTTKAISLTEKEVTRIIGKYATNGR